MKITIMILILCVLCVSVVQGDYVLMKYTIDNGGGTSTGGSFSLIGTIAQSDASYSEGGRYELMGGFWPAMPSCFVDFEDFAAFAVYWMQSGIDLPADLYEDGTVDLLDLQAFVDVWLHACPPDWPLD